MTSPGLKRPLDFEMIPQTSSTTGASPTSAPVAPVSNGTKRRCLGLSKLDYHNPNSPFTDPSLLLPPLADDIASMIQEEVHRLHGNNHCNGNEAPVLTLRQAQMIFERLIKEREHKLRDEYDKVLACKIAEQYDLLAKANYLNSYVESTRIPATLPPPTPNPSMNALAAAFTSIQRSTATAAPAIPELSNYAASLTANGHSNTLSSQHLAYSLQQQAAALQAQQQQQRTSINVGSVPAGPVLLASNLDEQLATPEALFTLFGVFGDVIRVKILFNKKDNALIQMADSSQAQVAQGYLDKQKVFGKVVRVMRSKHQLVQMPRESNQSDVGLTKDFTNSPLHRFKIPGSRNYLNIYPPSNTLHISNIPISAEESDIQKAFRDACGFDYCSFKFFPPNLKEQSPDVTRSRKMALMKFNSIEHATIALIKMHNFQISEENTLRVSFSKTVMQQ